MSHSQSVCANAEGSTAQCINSAASQWATPRSGQAVASWAVSILLSFAIETIAAMELVPEWAITALTALLSIANIVGPCVWVYQSQAHPATCMVYLFEAVVIWMKLISYAHVNSDLRAYLRTSRAAIKDGSLSPVRSPSLDGIDKWSLSSPNKHSASSQSLDTMDPTTGGANRALANLSEVKDLEAPFLQYPLNLTLPNLLYFCVAPTLCYQLNYPRSPTIRVQYVITILVRMFAIGAFIIFAVEQVRSIYRRSLTYSSTFRNMHSLPTYACTI